MKELDSDPEALGDPDRERDLSDVNEAVTLVDKDWVTEPVTELVTDAPSLLSDNEKL